MRQFCSQVVVIILFLLHATRGLEIGVSKLWLSTSIVGRETLSDTQWMNLYHDLIFGEEDADEEYDFIDDGDENKSTDLDSSNQVQSIRDLLYVIAEHEDFAPYDEKYNETCLILNHKKYSKSDDSFYFKTSELEAQAAMGDFELLAENEITIGTNSSAPIVILYGCETDLEFDDFNRNLFNEAKFGKIRMVWRPTCAIGEKSTYAYSETIPEALWGKEVKLENKIDIAGKKLPTVAKLEFLNQQQLEKLDIKFTALLLQKYEELNDFEKFFEYFKTLVSNFPAIAPIIAAKSDIDTASAEALYNKFKERQISHELLGLYVNGQQWRLTELDEVTLPKIIAEEYTKTNDLKEKLQNFGDVNLEKFLRYLTVGYSFTSFFDKNRYDFYRVPGFSEAVIFFNDFEKDKMYEKLPDQNDAFLEPSDFEPIPNIRQNWNELIFIINLDDPQSFEEYGAVNAFLEALEQMKTGYPVRLGLIPFSAQRSNHAVNQLYELKSKPGSLKKVKTYLKKLVRKPEIITKTTDEKSDQCNDFLERFKISNTVVVMNGVILPFQQKAWKIHTSRILFDDIEYLKREVRSMAKRNDLSVRQILHHRSLTIRNTNYLPNRMLDESFTRINNAALGELGERMIFYAGSKKPSPIHTVTIVDDFNAEGAIQKLEALLKNNHKGVAIRLVHMGALTKQWKIIRTEFSSGRLPNRKSYNKNCAFQSESYLNDLKSWLPDVPIDALRKPFVVINGKFFNTDQDLSSVELWHNILVQHSSKTLDTLNTLYRIGNLGSSEVDTSHIEELTASVIKYVYHSVLVFDNGIPYTTEASLPRVSLFELGDQMIKKAVEYPVVNITLLLDPAEERTQRLLYLTSLIKDLPFVKTEFALIPTSNLTMNPIYRFYNTSVETKKGRFESEIEHPHNFKADSDSIILEAHVFDENDEVSVNSVEGVPNVCIKLVDSEGNVIDKAISMTSFGYTQLSIPHFMRGMTIQSCDSEYTVTSFSTAGTSNYIESKQIDVTNTLPTKVYVKVKKTTNESTVLDDSKVNIMMVIHDGQESLAVAKIAKIKKESQDKMKFYILAKNPKLLAKIIPKSTDYELLNYAWPLWLRPQRFSEQELEAKSILLLDTILPKSIQKLVFISLKDDSLDNISLNDLSKYSEGVFYLREAKTEHDSYWKSGYWKTYLEKYDLPFYNLSASYVVNMQQLRRLDAASTLRLHYHLLSKSFTSLMNFKSDLLNSIQLKIPIISLNSVSKQGNAQGLEHDEL